MEQHRVCEACGDPLPINRSNRKYCDKCRGRVNTVRNRNASRIRSGCSTISCLFCGCNILTTSKTMLCHDCEILRDSRESHNDSIADMNKKETPSLPTPTAEEIRRNQDKLFRRINNREELVRSVKCSPSTKSSSKNKVKTEPVEQETTVPVSFHDRVDPESGETFIVECRGGGFYCGKQWRK